MKAGSKVNAHETVYRRYTWLPTAAEDEKLATGSKCYMPITGRRYISGTTNEPYLTFSSVEYYTS